MNQILKIVTASFLIALIGGCGSEMQSGQAVKTLGRSAVANKVSCPLKFANAGLCSEITWVNGPTADGDSSFLITFWNETTGKAEGPWTEPTAQVGAFIRMTCCGSVFFPKVSKVEEGKYLVSNVKFTPGKWEVYVQLKNGETVEKQFVTIKLED